MSTTLLGDGTFRWGSSGSQSFGVAVNVSCTKNAKLDDTATDDQGATACAAMYDENYTASCECFAKSGSTPPALGTAGTMTAGGVSVTGRVTSVGGVANNAGFARFNVTVTGWKNIT
jgi:hypothetical protein